MKSVLVVDDEPGVLAALRRTLHRLFAGALVVETCSDPLEALTLVKTRRHDLVISDLRMPEVDGLSFLCLVSAISPNSVRIVLTGSAEFDTAQRAINETGVFRYLCKPWEDAELYRHVEAALKCTNQ
jgi:YesN/AraC family two-component response regulator